MTDLRRARYVALFATEARSLLTGARRALSHWEADPTQQDGAEEIFRALHTIKGMAASLEFTETADLVHATETTLGAVRRGDHAATAAWLGDFELALDSISIACE